jgi:hypothetical protein
LRIERHAHAGSAFTDEQMLEWLLTAALRGGALTLPGQG